MAIQLEQPPIVEVFIPNVDALLQRASSFRRFVRLGGLQVEYAAERLADGSPPDGSVRHDSTSTAVAMLLAGEIFWRIGSALAASVRANAEVDRTVGENVRFSAHAGADILTPTPIYLDEVLNLSKRYSDEGGRAAFDVLSIELGSLKVVSALKIVFVTVVVGAAPAAPLATPVVTTALTAIGSFSAAGTLGFVVYTYLDEQHWREVDEQGDYLRSSADRGDWQPMQSHLAELGLYTGSIDNKVGPLTQQAIASFKRDAALADIVSHADPQFIKALAKAVVDQRRGRRSSK